MNDAQELTALVQKYLEGRLTSDQLDQLNQQLLKDAAARDYFLQMLNLDAALADALPLWQPAAEDGVSQSEIPSAAFPVKAPAPRPFVRPMALFSLMLGLVALVSWGLQRAVEPLAEVQHVAGVSGLAPQFPIHDDWYDIQAGTVELLTRRGARVVIEAPARFRFESAMKLHLPFGRLAAEVPPSAKGFTVVTPTGNAIDLGTRFGVDVPAQGHAEIHVFEGEVIAEPTKKDQRRSLLGGEAATLQAESEIPRDLRTAAFIQSEEVTALSAALAAGRQQHSDSAVSLLKNDPDLIALLDFEAGEAPAGVYRMVQGRWPGSRAAEFVHVGDHMKVDLDGSRFWPQLTLAAWVRLDHLGEPYQSLLHTDGWNENNPGQVHWMVTRHTTMRLALYGNTLAAGSIEKEKFPDSKTSVLPEQGRWVHLATVYDSQEKRVRFYLNGKFDSQTFQEVAHPARFGPSQIGNWDHQDRKLSGRVDDLILLGRALSDEEVRLLYEAGNPYR